MESWKNHHMVQDAYQLLGKVCRTVLDGLAYYHGSHTPAFVDMLDPVPLRPQMSPSSTLTMCNEEDYLVQEAFSRTSRSCFLTAIATNHMRVMVNFKT